MLILIVILVFLGWMECLDVFENFEMVNSEVNNDLMMIMVGDIMMGCYVREVIECYGEDFVFCNVELFFKNLDYVSGNYEILILINDVDLYKVMEKGIYLYSKFVDLVIVKNVGFDVLNLVNNYLMDYSVKGLEDMIFIFEVNKLDFVGVGCNFEEVKYILYKDVDGICIVIVGFMDVYLDGMLVGKNNLGILKVDLDFIFSMIQ